MAKPEVPTWKLVLEGADDTTETDDFLLEFFDVSSILGEPTLDRAFIDTIVKFSVEHEHYSIFRNLKEITSDTGENMTGLAIWALMGIVKDTGQKIGILFGALADGRVHLIAVWPRDFYDQIRADSLLIDRIIEKFSNDPKFWAQVDLIIGFI